jgi:hypothetical protein
MKGFFLFFPYYIQHCFFCRPSDSTVPTDAGIEPRTVATGALAGRRSKHFTIGRYRYALISELYICFMQGCGAEMFIPDPGSKSHRIPDPDPQQKIQAF